MFQVLKVKSTINSIDMSCVYTLLCIKPILLHQLYHFKNESRVFSKIEKRMKKKIFYAKIKFPKTRVLLFLKQYCETTRIKKKNLKARRKKNNINGKKT